MATAFDVLAEPGRRGILDLLCGGERPVGDIVEQFDLSQPAVSKHLRVLRDAGFVEARIDAQRRVYRLRPQALREIDAWLAPYRALWTASLDRLEHHLDEMDSKPRGSDRVPASLADQEHKVLDEAVRQNVDEPKAHESTR